MSSASLWTLILAYAQAQEEQEEEEEPSTCAARITFLDRLTVPGFGFERRDREASHRPQRTRPEAGGPPLHHRNPQSEFEGGEEFCLRTIIDSLSLLLPFTKDIYHYAKFLYHAVIEQLSSVN